VIDLQVEKPPHLLNYAYRLNISSVFGPDGQKKVRNGGGELLAAGVEFIDENGGGAGVRLRKG
jgi:hypothetical protein